MPEGPYHLLVESGDGTGARPERPVPGWIEGAYSGWQLGTGFVTVGALTRCQHGTGGLGRQASSRSGRPALSGSE